jgi:4-amino-4-deoxy-L-arabinose transferase-like glycosyltransferase
MTRKNPTFWLLLLGALSFLPTLFFYLVGEEGIYVITAMETWQHHTWMQEIMYGVDDMRPPLLNWITMPLAELFGWSHLVFVVRLVSVSATLGSVAWLYWLCRKLFSDKSFALFAALSALALADLLLYRGWLSYTDPVFAFFTFGAMATLWIAGVEHHRGWLLLSVLLVGCALLTKAFTSYVFYGTTGLVLFLLQRDTRRFFLSPSVLLIFALALIVPWAWFSSIPRSENSAFMFDEIMRKFSAHDAFGYLKNLVEFPLEMFARLSPAALLASYLLLRKRVSLAENAPAHFNTAILIAGLCFLPYWLSPQNSVRYLLPIYPIIALICARIIWRAGEGSRTLALRWFAGIIAFKFVFALFLFPYYQTHYRGENYEETAQIMIDRTRSFPLFIKDTRSVGLAITAYIDLKRFPQAPLTYPPKSFDSGFVLSMEENPALGEVAEVYPLAADKIFLLCRGAACTATPHTEK